MPLARLSFVLLLAALGSTAFGQTSAPAKQAAVGLAPGQGLSLRQDGAKVVGKDEPAEVRFVHLPKTFPSVTFEVNPFTNAVERRERYGHEESPALQAKHAAAYKEKPDLAKLTLGDVVALPATAMLTEQDKFALVHTENGENWLLTIDGSQLPQKLPAEWRINVRAEPATIARGGKGEAPLGAVAGRLVYRDRENDVYSLRSLEMASGARGIVVAKDAGKAPRLSRDGKRIATAGEAAIDVTDANGNRVGGVKLEKVNLRMWNLSPDGAQLAVSLSREKEDVSTEYLTAVYTTDGKLLREFANTSDPVFMPDGRVVLCGFGEEKGFFIGDVASGKKSPIDIGEAEAAQPAVSPDGKLIAFVSSQKVWTIGVDGKGKRAIWEAKQLQELPCFSPDGKSIALIAMDPTAYSLPRPVMIVDITTGKAAELQDNKGQPIYPEFDSPINWVK